MRRWIISCWRILERLDWKRISASLCDSTRIPAMYMYELVIYGATQEAIRSFKQQITAKYECKDWEELDRKSLVLWKGIHFYLSPCM